MPAIGDAIIAGAAGFAVGTIFGNATAAPRYYAPAPVYVGPPVIYRPMPVYYYAPAPWTPEWYAYCARKYQSFDARSGTYLGFDGLLDRPLAFEVVKWNLSRSFTVQMKRPTIAGQGAVRAPSAGPPAGASGDRIMRFMKPIAATWR